MTREVFIMIRFCQYNTHLFEGTVAAWGRFFGVKIVFQDGPRARNIAYRLGMEQPDVVGLSEVWSSEYQNYFSGQVKDWPGGASAYNTFLPNVSPIVPLGPRSGLVLIVKGNFKETPEFRKYSGLIGADRLSPKGVAGAIVNLSDSSTIKVIITHTQADYTDISPDKTRQARKEGFHKVLYPMIDDLLKQDPTDAPLFLMGDLNIVAGSDEYKDFCSSLDKYGLSDAFDSGKCDGNGYTYDATVDTLVTYFDDTQRGVRQRLDYLFHTGQASCEAMHVAQDYVIGAHDKDTVNHLLDLSDHFPLRVDFSISGK
jgi:endonuclease/exonuclease/phosphatase family metal-dependent hydrolase